MSREGALFLLNLNYSDCKSNYAAAGGLICTFLPKCIGFLQMPPGSGKKKRQRERARASKIIFRATGSINPKCIRSLKVRTVESKNY